MKILYITNHIDIAKASGGFINDYMNDLLFYGLYEMYGNDVVASTPIIHLYKENKQKIPEQVLWGKGFTAAYLIESDTADRTDIEEKIKNISNALLL